MKFENNQAFIKDFIIDLTKLIGQGQFGSIFECASTKNNTIKYCAKIIKINCENEKFCQREKEISEIIQGIQDNPNLVSVFHVEYISSQKLFVIIMERCDSNLKDLWEQKKKFNECEINQFILQFLNGYKVLYQKNIIHKDIKPDNILIKNQNGQIIYKIGDFGLSKVYKNNQIGNNNDISRNGTPVYSAPEVSTLIKDQQVQQQLLEIKNIMNAKSQIDVYSLGVILYQMIYGDFPFELTESSIFNFFQRIKNNPLKLTGQCSKYIQLVEKMLIYNPNERLSFYHLYNQFNQNIQPQTINFQNINFKKINEQDPKKLSQNYNQFVKIEIGTKQFENPFQQQHKQQANNIKIEPSNIQFQKQNPQICIQNNNNFNPPSNVFKVIQTKENPHQQIKEFLNYLKCDCQWALNDSTKQIIENVNKCNIVNETAIKQLQYLFPFELQNLEKYQPKTLQFQYSILCLLKDPKCFQINITNQAQIKSDLANYYQKSN